MPPIGVGIAAVAGPGQVSITVFLAIPPPTVGIIIQWGTVLGGPYPNSKEFPVFGPYVLTVLADGLVVGTTYYFIAFSDNGSGCISGPSNESSAAPQPGPAGVTHINTEAGDILATESNLELITET